MHERRLRMKRYETIFSGGGVDTKDQRTKYITNSEAHQVGQSPMLTYDVACSSVTYNSTDLQYSMHIVIWWVAATASSDENINKVDSKQYAS